MEYSHSDLEMDMDKNFKMWKDNDILLEEKIREEFNEGRPRRSKRLAEKKIQSQINAAYEAYENSLKAAINNSQ